MKLLVLSAFVATLGFSCAARAQAVVEAGPEQDSTALWASTEAKCAAPDAGNEGMSWNGSRLAGFEWYCDVAGPGQSLQDGTAYVAACNEEGIETTRVIWVRTYSDEQHALVDVSDYGARILTRCN